MQTVFLWFSFKVYSFNYCVGYIYIYIRPLKNTISYKYLPLCVCVRARMRACVHACVWCLCIQIYCSLPYMLTQGLSLKSRTQLVQQASLLWRFPHLCWVLELYAGITMVLQAGCHVHQHLHEGMQIQILVIMHS